MHAFASFCSKKANTHYRILKRLERGVIQRNLSWNKMKDIEVSKVTEIPSKRIVRGLSILDFILRIVAAIGTIAGALAMGTAKETLPFTTQFLRFRARFNDLPTLVFFVVANSLVCGYLLLTLIISFFHIVWSKAVKTRILLAFLDTAMFGLLMAATAAATAIVFVAHRGNTSANWFPICQQYNNFCERISGALIASYVAAVLLMLIIFLSQVAISRQ